MPGTNQYPVAIASLKDSGIQTPADLKGKKIGVPILSGASYVGMESLLSAGGLKDADVQIDVIGFNQVETLTTGKEDASSSTSPMNRCNWPSWAMRPPDESLRRHVAGLEWCNHQREDDQGTPRAVKAMNAALARGVAYTRANPDEAYEICKKYVENLANCRSGSADERAQDIHRHVPDRTVRPDIRQAWENMQTVLLQMGLLTEKQDLSKAYSNDFLTQPK